MTRPPASRGLPPPLRPPPAAGQALPHSLHRSRTATSRCTAGAERGGEGQPGGSGVPVARQGSPGHSGQRGHQAGEVEGPGAAVAADELTAVAARRALVLVLLGSGRGGSPPPNPHPGWHCRTACAPGDTAAPLPSLTHTKHPTPLRVGTACSRRCSPVPPVAGAQPGQRDLPATPRCPQLSQGTDTLHLTCWGTGSWLCTAGSGSRPWGGTGGSPPCGQARRAFG